jgi:hypothetical protein
VTAPPAIYTSLSPSGAPLIYLKDSVSHTNYLVDTGAAISLLPFSSSLSPTGPVIVNANGSPIPSWNFVRKQLKFGKNSFVHSFLQAKVSQPILGLDFLSRYNITIDCNASRVLFPSPKPLPAFSVTPPPHPVPATPTANHSPPPLASSPLSPPTSQCPPDVLALLNRYPSVTCPSYSSPPPLTSKCYKKFWACLIFTDGFCRALPVSLSH